VLVSPEVSVLKSWPEEIEAFVPSVCTSLKVCVNVSALALRDEYVVV